MLSQAWERPGEGLTSYHAGQYRTGQQRGVAGLPRTVVRVTGVSRKRVSLHQFRVLTVYSRVSRCELHMTRTVALTCYNSPQAVLVSLPTITQEWCSYALRESVYRYHGGDRNVQSTRVG